MPFGIGAWNNLAIVEDRKSNVWICILTAGACRYNRDADTFTRFQHDPNDLASLSSDNVVSISKDNHGDIWISTTNGINHFIEETQSFEHYFHHADNPKSLASDYCFYVCQDRSSRYWITHALGLDQFDATTNTFFHFKYHPDDPSSLSSADERLPVYEDHFGRLWILVQGDPCGINIHDPQTNRFHRYLSNYNDPRAFQGEGFYFCGSDRTGTLWIGSRNQTINRVYPNTNPFLTLEKSNLFPKTLQSNSIHSLFASRRGNIIWLASSEGLTKYEWEKRTFSHFRHNPDNPNSLCDNHVNDLVEDDRGNLWIATNNGLDKLDMSGKFTHFKSIPGDSTVLTENSLLHLDYDPAGYLWICTYLTGLNRLNLNTRQVKQLIKDQKNPTSLSGEEQVFYTYKDRAGDLWIGAGLGLSKYNYATESFKLIARGFVPVNMFEDRQGNFWIGTLFEGVLKLNRETGEWRRFNDGHPLSQGAVTDILEDDEGLLWIGTNQGLVKFNPMDSTCMVFGEEHGLPAHQNLTAGARRHDGQILWGSRSRGVIQFDPKEIRLNDQPPQVVISDIKISNLSLSIGQDSPLKQDISLTTDLKLHYDQNDISFVCAALHYVRPEKNRYAFWLENYDDGWYEAGTNRTATYTNLDPGRYIFHVKAANCDGVWNEEGRSLRVRIQPPWYASWWSYGIYFFILAGIVYALWTNQTRRIHLRNELRFKEMQAEKLQEIDHMKTQFLANISHEFRTPLTLILGPIDTLLKHLTKEEDKNELSMMRRNALRLSRLVNQLLDLSKIEAGKMTLQARLDDIVHFANRVVQSFESRAKLKNIALTFAADRAPIPLYFDHEKMEHVLYNLLSNAIKFTPENGSVEVTIHTAVKAGEKTNFPDGAIDIAVRDTGVGIRPGQVEKIFDRFYQGEGAGKIKDAGTGIGLALAKQLVELHSGSIMVQSVVGTGSTFTVRMPLGASHLKEEEISEIAPAEQAIEDIAEPEKPRAVSPLKAPAILIVEDNADLRYYMRSILADAYKITEAENGLAGFEAAASHIPELIITDVMMPEMDGYELCDKLKADERTSHIPIIMLTARADLDSKIHGLETGADDYLVKPFDEKELKVRVKNLIEGRQKLRRRFGRDILAPISDIAITSADERFLRRVVEIISSHMTDSSFGPEPMARAIGLSRSQLHRKLKAIVDMSATTFIRSVRLRRAAELLSNRFGTIGEIAYAVGFGNPGYFSETFRRQFGCLPSEYRAASEKRDDS
ncbi:response regulator [candidate division KSB1 bacterium]|nr:response regulator [candidate division KSB1 bacterium]